MSFTMKTSFFYNGDSGSERVSESKTKIDNNNVNYNECDDDMCNYNNMCDVVNYNTNGDNNIGDNNIKFIDYVIDDDFNQNDVNNNENVCNNNNNDIHINVK